MEHNLSKSEIEALKKALEKATPYDADDPIWNDFDGERDNDRVAASFAKRILDEYYAEQRQKGSEQDSL